MSDSLRDQLLKSGIVKQVQQERVRNEPPKPKGGRNAAANTNSRNAKSAPPKQSHRQSSSREQSEIDLAKAYAIRAQTEASERKRIEEEAAEQARLRKERKLKIQRLLEGHTLNKADADQPRNFQYGDKIRRVYVDAGQLQALNAGELGVVQQAGRYLLVTRALAEQVRDIDPHQVALLVDATAGADDDGVPDDLMW